MSAQPPVTVPPPAVPPHHCSCLSSSTASTSPETHSKLLVRFLNSFGKTAKDPSPAVRRLPRAGTKLLWLPHPGSPVTPVSCHGHCHLSVRCQGCSDTHTSPGQLLTSCSHPRGSNAVLCRPGAEWRCGLGQPRALARCLQLKALMEQVVTAGQSKGKSPRDTMLLVRRYWPRWPHWWAVSLRPNLRNVTERTNKLVKKQFSLAAA